MCLRGWLLTFARTTILAATIVVVPAQDPEPDPARVIGVTMERQLLLEVTSRLASKDLATIAWGGYLAAQHRVASSVPHVLQALRNLPEGANRRYAAQSLLDALAVHGAKVPAEDLQEFHSGLHEGVALVLAGFDASANRDFLFDLYRSNDQQGRYSRWLAAGNLLAHVKDREFARYLVGQLAYQLEVHVCDVGSLVGFGVGGAFGGRFADGSLLTPMGFPPSVTYRVVVDAKPHDVLFATGPVGVYYRREVHHARKVGTGGSERMKLRGRQQQRVEWLAAMLGQYVVEMPAVAREAVEWQDAATLRATVGTFRQLLIGKHDQLIGQAIQAGWFEEKDRVALAAKVAVKLFDRRSDPESALPQIE